MANRGGESFLAVSNSMGKLACFCLELVSLSSQSLHLSCKIVPLTSQLNPPSGTSQGLKMGLHKPIGDFTLAMPIFYIQSVALIKF